MKTIGVLSSGGDSPGMNAAIRAVVRSGLSSQLTIYGVYGGFYGLYHNHITPLLYQHVSEKINQGGTFLGSARFPEFAQVSIRQHAIQQLKQHGIEALVVIGGDGSYAGANALTNMGYPCIALPGTIDNDIPGTDYTIGYMTALETVLEAIDRLRDTSSSHERISIVEVMGRHCGELALKATIAGGCEYVVIPEIGFDENKLMKHLTKAINLGKKHAIVVITEGMVDAYPLAARIEAKTGKETRATVLGHIQRGGRPIGFDRILASQMGDYAVQLLLSGQGGRCVGVEKNQLVHHEITTVITQMQRPLRKDLLTLAEKLY